MVSTLLLLLPIAAMPANESSTEPKRCLLAAYGGSTASADNSEAMHKAIADCEGGTVVVAGGYYKTGPVQVSGQNITVDVQDDSALVTAYGPQHWCAAYKRSGERGGGSSEYPLFSECSDQLIHELLFNPPASYPMPPPTHRCRPHDGSNYIDILTFSECAGCTLTG